MKTSIPEPIGKSLSPQDKKSVKCEICKMRVRIKDANLCRRCIDISERELMMGQLSKERIIQKRVGERYATANIQDIDAFANIPVPLPDMYFCGPVGTGKTYAMAALLRHFIYLGYECRRINFDDFCVQVRSTFSKASEQTEWKLIQPLIDSDILFIDDLGLRSKEESDFAYVTLYSILNKRQERMLPTIISSNKTISQLERSFDSRIASRLKMAHVVEFTGKDRRAKG